MISLLRTEITRTGYPKPSPPLDAICRYATSVKLLLSIFLSASCNHCTSKDTFSFHVNITPIVPSLCLQGVPFHIVSMCDAFSTRSSTYPPNVTSAEWDRPAVRCRSAKKSINQVNSSHFACPHLPHYLTDGNRYLRLQRQFFLVPNSMNTSAHLSFILAVTIHMYRCSKQSLHSRGMCKSVNTRHFMVHGCQHYTQSQNCRTTPCQLSATAYTIYSQMYIQVAVLLSRNTPEQMLTNLFTTDVKRT
jgi:hypothetical protein